MDASDNQSKQSIQRFSTMSVINRKSSKLLENIDEQEIQPELRVLDRNPMPRDGHAAVVMYNSLFIFGGDRHRMPFNDLLILPLNNLV